MSIEESLEGATAKHNRRYLTGNETIPIDPLLPRRKAAPVPPETETMELEGKNAVEEEEAAASPCAVRDESPSSGLPMSRLSLEIALLEDVFNRGSMADVPLGADDWVDVGGEAGENEDWTQV